jgi:Na+-transporting NADH:ubiquinone oxidoreductase subunit A
VHDVEPPTRVGLVAADYPGLRARLEVEVGEEVARGQRLLSDKKNPDLTYTSPGSGRVVAIHRGERRAFLSVEIELSAEERTGRCCNDVAFDSFTAERPDALEAEAIESLLLESGLWTAFRTRPFSRVPAPGTTPAAIFVTAMDTHPLAPDVDVVLAGRREEFDAGLCAVAHLSGGPTYLCTAASSSLVPPECRAFRHERFAGPHPAGTPGLHIHTLDPVRRGKVVWHIGYQDVAAIGTLLRTGRLDLSRVVALAGPGVRRPRLVRTRLGASLRDLVAGELLEGEQRVISGSVLGGRTAAGEAEGYLGRYHNQVTVVREGRERELFGWLKPGRDRFSVTNAFLSAFSRGRRFDFTTSTHGSARPMVPIGTYERVMPMDLEPTFLLRSLIVGDLEQAEMLGCLELDEEDLALCTFVCPGKYEYGPLLRDMLDRIDREA